MVLQWDEAKEILATVREESEDDPRLRGLRRAWLVAAVRYAQARAEWHLAPREERIAQDQHRTQLHEAFIDSCNALSRNLSQLEKDFGWRRRLGDDRKTIGDLACYLHCLLGLEAR
jgi:glutathione S-transferase